MNSQDFDKCRQFLEDQLSKNIDNKELLATYQKLIELKSQYDTATDKALIEKEIREAELNTQFRTAAYANDTDLNKAVHSNITNSNMAWNAQQAESQRHHQTTVANTMTHAMSNGYQPWQPMPGTLPHQSGQY
ncbi:hypothetical protein V3O09_07140 [Stenotrophomonas maltophilia]|nr:hypothetical protein [Stenotrophomonas maltophilia]